MISYIYDGTFEGLLTVIAGAIDGDDGIQAITSGELQGDLFTEIQKVTTDPVLAGRLFDSLKQHLSRTALLNIAYCFLSEETGIEKVILDYLRLLLKHGEQFAGNYSNPSVFKIQRTCERVAHEILRMQGFIRFRKLYNGVYYAPIAPDHNIIQLLAPHFKDRFADQLWLIHDTRRNTGIYYDGSRVKFISFLEMTADLLSVSNSFSSTQQSNILDQDELNYQRLWDQYFQRIAITERRNKRQQRQRMPERYWQYLVERVE